jgi:putative transposase
MNTKKVAAEYRLAKWAGIIQERKNSGKSIKDFCLDTGISMHSYFYFQKKLRMATCDELSKGNETTELVPAGWIQLTTEKQNRTATIEVEIGGCHINVSKETDPELLKQVCLMLRSL